MRVCAASVVATLTCSWLFMLCGTASAQIGTVPARVYLVPIAIGASHVRVHSTAEYFREALGLDVVVAPEVDPSPTAYDSDRQQFVAERFLAQLSGLRQLLLHDSSATVIGITGLDIYAAEISRWQFVFSYRGASSAIVSYARMDPRNFGKRADEDLLQSRLRKMVAKDIGILAYGLQMTRDPKSLMSNSILGLDELDFIEENFARAGMTPVPRR
jgi:predicted Zn-dependent protease